MKSSASLDPGNVFSLQSALAARRVDWTIRATDLARALGYKNQTALATIVARHRDEFPPDGYKIINVNTAGGSQACALCTFQFCVSLAPHVRTAMGKELRRWVLDVLHGPDQSGANSGVTQDAAPGELHAAGVVDFLGDWRRVSRLNFPRTPKFERGYLMLVQLPDDGTMVVATRDPAGNLLQKATAMERLGQVEHMRDVAVTIPHINFRENAKLLVLKLSDQTQVRVVRQPMDVVMGMLNDLSYKKEFTALDIEHQRQDAEALHAALTDVYHRGRKALKQLRKGGKP